MHEKNKLELNRHGVEEFFEINMMSATRIRNAISLPETSPQINKNKSKNNGFIFNSILVFRFKRKYERLDAISRM